MFFLQFPFPPPQRVLRDIGLKAKHSHFEKTVIADKLYDDHLLDV